MAGPPPSHAPAHLNPALLSSSTSGVSSEANISQPNSADYEGSWPPPAPPQNLFLERIREQQDKLKSLRAQHWQMLQQTPDSRTRSLAGGPPSGPPPLALGGSGSWEAGPRLDRTRGGDGSAAESAFPNQASVMTALAQLEHRISLMSSLPPPEPPEERPPVPSQLDSEYLDRLNLMNNDRGRTRVATSPKHLERDKSSEELSELQDRLRSLQSMVNNLEQQQQQPPIPPPPVRSSWESDRSSHPNRPSHDQMMVEMREQLRLQKELHLRRKELEDLMKKDIVESMQKNFSDSKSDISFRSWFHDDRSLRHLDSNVVPSSSRSRRLSLSSIPSHAQASSDLEYAKNYAHLQAQIDSLQSEIQRLNSISRSAGVPSNPPNEMGGVARPPPNLDPGVLEAIFQQQNQIQQLTNSLNQCFQGMMLVQRDVNHLQKAMDKISHRQQQETSNERQQVRGQNGGEFDPWQCHLPDIDFRPIGAGVSRTNPNFQTMGGLTGLENSHATWLQTNPPSSFGHHDPWNLNSQLNHLNDPEANGALNNQVAPGMRANNYWDNFRSYSRQNRLSNASPGSMQQPPNVVNPIVATSHAVSGVVTGSGAPNVAQVTPRQLQANPSVPSVVSGNSVGQGSDRGSSLPRQALIEPHFSNVNNSPPRPRRKQKINREQNRESSSETRSAAMVLPSCSNTASNQPTSSATNGAVGRSNEANGSIGGAAAAAMVYPMPQNHDRNINRSDYHTQPTNDGQSTPSNMMVNSLTTSIYQHIGSLINEYESRPDHLVRILQDIQVLGRSFPIALSRNQSEIEAPFAGWPSNAGPVYPEHLHDNRDNRHCMTASSPKVPTDKRFSFSRSEATNIFGLDGARGNSNSVNPQSIEGIFHPFSASVNRRQGAQAGAENDAEANDMAQSSEDPEPTLMNNSNTNQSKRLASESVAVPKNVQRNQISRERDTRKFRREKPRNMQQAAIVLASNSSSSETIEDIRSGDQEATPVLNRVPDESGFINVNFRLPMASVAASTNATTVTQASSTSDVMEARSLAPGPSSTAGLNDMAEADQDQSPETSMQNQKRCVVVDGAKAYLDSSDEDEILVQDGSDEGGATSMRPETEDQMGLDRVPTRLSSHSLSQQRQNEEINLRSLVDEVLNTSSESELVEDALDVPPPPSTQPPRE